MGFLSTLWMIKYTTLKFAATWCRSVQDYKYLGVHLDNKLNLAKNMEAVYKKCQCWLYFLSLSMYVTSC